MYKLTYTMLAILLLAGCSSQKAVISELQTRLKITSNLMEQTKFVDSQHKVSCSNADFNAGRCFAPACAPCKASVFNQIADKKAAKIACLNPGPLGTGLLCQVSPSDKACCDQGKTCQLTEKKGSVAVANSPDNFELFPPLKKRKFSNGQCIGE